MVKIMVTATPQQEPDWCCEEDRSGTFLGWGTSNTSSRIDHLPKDASSATFWCAVALGALAKGSPFEAVESYSQLAEEALAACRSNSTNVELAGASAILTYVYSFMGDMAKFREYGELSECFLRTSVEQGSADTDAGLRYLVQHCRKVGCFQNEPVDSSWIHEEAPLQLKDVATERDLYRFIAHALRTFSEDVLEQAREWCSDDLEGFFLCGPAHRNSHPNDPMPGEVSEALMTVFKTTNSLDFEPLQEAADRRGIRSGVGDLLINGTLLYGTAAKGDLDATLQKLDRSIEVYERYPGLCRCMMGSHMSHMLLATLAAINDSRARAMYERLRGTFNSCRASHTLPMPPLDKWQGMAAICNDFHCRVMGALIESKHMKAFTALTAESVQDSAGLAQAVSNPLREKTGGVSHRNVAHGEIASVAQACPSRSCTGPNPISKWTGNEYTAEAVHCAGAALPPLVSRSDPSNPSGTGSGSALSVDGVANEALSPSPRSASIGGRHRDIAGQDKNEIAAADWLEVAHALLDGAHPSEVNH